MFRRENSPKNILRPWTAYEESVLNSPNHLRRKIKHSRRRSRWSGYVMIILEFDFEIHYIQCFEQALRDELERFHSALENPGVTTTTTTSEKAMSEKAAGKQKEIASTSRLGVLPVRSY